jgi:hypothetical protein
MWNRQISRILCRAKADGVINSKQLHEMAAAFDPTQKHKVYGEFKAVGFLPRLLAIACMLIMLGCSHEPSAEIKARAAELSSGFRQHAEAITAKQDESLTLLAQVNSRVGDLLLAADATKEQIQTLKASLANPQAQQSGGDPAALGPQETERESQNTPSLPVSVPAVRLYVTSSESCPPCVRLWKAVENGKFSGFDVQHSTDFEGLRSYPAIRFQDPQGQWKVLYGYDDTTVETLRRLTSAKQFVWQPRITNPVVSQESLVSIHNRLHGGGSWTWPGGTQESLATHLRESHGVNTSGGAPLTGAMFPNYATSGITSQRVSVRSLPRRVSYVGRANYSTRQSCPTCPR